MGRLTTWKAYELRKLAALFREQARATQLQKYVELLGHAADDLDAEADVMERTGKRAEERTESRPGRSFDFYA